MIRKREPHWQSAAERARVAAELIEEAELLTETGGIATPADVKRASLPPPLVVTPPAAPREAAPSGIAPPAREQLETPPAAPAPPAATTVPTRQELEQLVFADPANVDALATLGALLARKGLWSQALPHLRRAVELAPERGAAGHQLGESLNRVDDLAGARAAYERALALDPRNARALYGLGIVLDRLKRPDEATQMYRRSREAAGR